MMKKLFALLLSLAMATARGSTSPPQMSTPGPPMTAAPRPRSLAETKNTRWP